MDLKQLINGYVNQNTNFIEWCEMMIKRYGDVTGCYAEMKLNAEKTNQELQADLKKMN